MTHCVPDGYQSSMGSCSLPRVAATSGATPWSRGEPGNGRPITGCLADGLRERFRPSSAEAIRSLRGQGRRIAVGSWFLAPGLHYTRQAELALEAGAVAVSAPMGGEPEIAEVALDPIRDCSNGSGRSS